MTASSWRNGLEFLAHAGEYAVVASLEWICGRGPTESSTSFLSICLLILIFLFKLLNTGQVVIETVSGLLSKINIWQLLNTFHALLMRKVQQWLFVIWWHNHCSTWDLRRPRPLIIKVARRMSVCWVLLRACLVSAASTGASASLHISFYEFNFIFDENHFTRKTIYFPFNLSRKRFESTG